MRHEEGPILIERFHRQGLLRPVQSEADYLRLFQSLQPVSPIANSRPGDPPSLTVRAAFRDNLLSNRLRRERRIVKARFLSGVVGYVFADQLGDYAAAFQRPLARFNRVQGLVLDTIQRAGPVTPAQIKEETGLLSKEIGPALQRLQAAFLVYEDQVDSNWDRAWYDFSGEWPSIDLPSIDSSAALVKVVHNFLQAHLFATLRQISDWCGLPRRQVAAAVDALESSGRITRVKLTSSEEGWICGPVPDRKAPAGFKRAIMLHQGDMLVRSHKSELKERFGAREVLQYLLINGKFRGAVIGHWRIGPHDVDDIVLELPRREAEDRKEEVLAEVARFYHPPRSFIRRYSGKAL